MNENKKSIDSDNDERSFGTVGIYNLGNTCFLNTGLNLQKIYKADIKKNKPYNY